MKKKKAENKKNMPELYYKILKECAENESTTVGDLNAKLGISISDNSFKNMIVLKFINIDNNLIELLPQGYSTYLSVSSQKQSSQQATKATNRATWALVISIATFLASIIFNIITLSK